MCDDRSSCIVCMHQWQELSPTTNTNMSRSLMNIHESMLDEFKDEQTLKQLELSHEHEEAWIMVRGWGWWAG